MALAGLAAVVREVANADAPAEIIVCHALADNLTGSTAGAAAHADVTLVFLQPVGQVLDVHGLIFHGNGFFHRDDMHSDACASGRYHLGNVGQGNERHTFKEGSHVRMLLKTGIASVRQLLHVEQLGGTGHEHGQNISALRLFPGAAIVVVMIAVIVLQKSDIAHLIQQLLEFFFTLLRDFVQVAQLGKGVGHALFHG